MTSKPTSHIQDPVATGMPRALTSAIVVLAALIAMAIPIEAYSGETASKATGNATAETGKKKGSLKIKHQRSPSEETVAERARRLKRECRGAPNAGACLGYTR